MHGGLPDSGVAQVDSFMPDQELEVTQPQAARAACPPAVQALATTSRTSTLSTVTPSGAAALTISLAAVGRVLRLPD